MTRTITPSSSSDSSFDAFLQAAVAEGGNGLPVSVLSLFARLDRDPWSEAAELDRLAPKLASERLIELIGMMPQALLTGPEASSVATHLIGLLPHGRSSPKSRSAVPGGGPAAAPLRRIVLLNIILISIFLVVRYTISGLSHQSVGSEPPAAPVGANTAIDSRRVVHHESPAHGIDTSNNPERLIQSPPTDPR